MKVLLTNIVAMLAVIVLGKRSKHMRAKEYAIIAIIALVQVVVAVYSMYTMQEPPLY